MTSACFNPNSKAAWRGGAIEDVLHEQAADATLLDCGVDRDGTDAGDR